MIYGDLILVMQLWSDYYKEKDAQKSLFYANKMYEIAQK